MSLSVLNIYSHYLAFSYFPPPENFLTLSLCKKQLAAHLNSLNQKGCTNKDNDYGSARRYSVGNVNLLLRKMYGLKNKQSYACSITPLSKQLKSNDLWRWSLSVSLTTSQPGLCFFLTWEVEVWHLFGLSL